MKVHEKKIYFAAETIDLFTLMSSDQLNSVWELC